MPPSLETLIHMLYIDNQARIPSSSKTLLYVIFKQQGLNPFQLKDSALCCF
jgi:hypothetical protein